MQINSGQGLGTKLEEILLKSAQGPLNNQELETKIIEDAPPPPPPEDEGGDTLGSNSFSSSTEETDSVILSSGDPKVESREASSVTPGNGTDSLEERSNVGTLIDIIG